MAAERRMMKTNYWSHNSAYYPWVLEKTRGCQRVLDVGCGNGELALMLGRGGRSVVGIDPSKECIAEARVRAGGERVRFACASFDDYDADGRFDAIVGLASPSSTIDHAIELLRVVPSWISSKMHHMRTSEDLDIPTSYELPTMAQVREVASRLLPGAAIRHGLHWRYLLTWREAIA